MTRGFTAALVAAALVSCRPAAAATASWAVAKSPRFEVYSHQGPERAQSGLAWFEQVATFFSRNGLIADLNLDRRAAVKVIGFASEAEYNSFRLRAMADAYYVGTADRDYIVIPAMGGANFAVAAHEYAHLVLHNRGLNLPAWLAEGLAEVFSTVSINGRKCEFGGELPARRHTMRRHAPIPLTDLLAIDADSAVRQRRDGTDIFYAESWELTSLLISSPDYAPHFTELLAKSSSGSIGVEAFSKIYGKPLAEIAEDLSKWVDRVKPLRQVILPDPRSEGAQASEIVSEFEAGKLMAELLVANGQWDRAEAVYQGLNRQSPRDPCVLAALGTVALHKGDRALAMKFWHEAIERDGVDASLCFRYATLADEAGMPLEEIAPVLERAIALRPDFDNARFRLALLRSNEGNYAAAVAQLHAMPRPSGARAFGYWSVMAYAQSELGNRNDAADAAQQAMRHAVSDSERARATQLLLVARTDVDVQFARDANGQARLVATRIPHGTHDWNPFAEPGDRIRRVEGKLREVQCVNGSLAGILVDTESGPLRLSVSDPKLVLIRSGPSELQCGSANIDVAVEYAATADGQPALLRGLEFR